MQKYVLVHTRNQIAGKVLLIQSPKGKLNLLGGKVEKGKTETSAAMWFLKKDAGVSCLLPSFCGAILRDDSIVYCYSVNAVDAALQDNKKNVEWFELSKVLSDSRLMPELKILIPLLHMDVNGWILNNNKNMQNEHEVTLSFDVKNYYSGK